MPLTPVTVTDAHLAQREGAIIIDVRTRAEYAAGHPAGAINVPVMDTDEDTGQRIGNPDFVRIMQAAFSPDARLLLLCQSGNRSSRAAQMLEVFGFTRVVNITGGIVAWEPAGLPVDRVEPEGRTYADLLAVADAAEE